MENRLTRSKSNLEQVLQDMSLQEKNRNYLQAEELKKQAQKLKENITKLEKKSDKLKQKKQVKEVSEMYDEELKTAKLSWEMEMEEFKVKSDEQLKQLKEKHDQELREIQENFEKEEIQYHDSGAVIELKRKEDYYAKNASFMEAYEMQQEKIKLKSQQTENLEKLRQQKLKIQLRKATLRQQTETEALKKKIQTRMQEFKKMASKGEQILSKRHKNILGELIVEQEKQNLAKSGLIKNNLTLCRSKSPSSTMRSPMKKMVTQKLFAVQTK